VLLKQLPTQRLDGAGAAGQGALAATRGDSFFGEGCATEHAVATDTEDDGCSGKRARLARWTIVW